MKEKLEIFERVIEIELKAQFAEKLDDPNPRKVKPQKEFC